MTLTEQVLLIRTRALCEAFTHLAQGHPGRAEYALARADLRITTILKHTGDPS